MGFSVRHYLGDSSLSANKLRSFGAKRLGEHDFVPNFQVHPKIEPADIFSSGFLLPAQTLDLIRHYNGKERKIKKYDGRFPSLFRSILRGKFDYILYDSHAFFTTCEGCLRGLSPNNYLGKGGEAKVKIAQVVQNGEYVAVRISKKIGKYELEILKKMGLLIDYVNTGNKHYIIQKLLSGARLSDNLYYSSFRLIESNEQYVIVKKIMIQLLLQLNVLHVNGYLHRDIASDNIMINPQTHEATLIDFGYAAKEPSYWNGYVYGKVSKFYLGMAPELSNCTFYGYPYSQQSDLYALGMIFEGIVEECKSEPARALVQSVCKEMLAKSPQQRKNATYYLNLIENS